MLQGQDVPARYNADTERDAREAWQHGVALVDRSDCGRLRFVLEGRMQFLHSQSTQSLLDLEPGKGAETVRSGSICIHSASVFDAVIYTCRLHRDICHYASGVPSRNAHSPARRAQTLPAQPCDISTQHLTETQQCDAGAAAGLRHVHRPAD